MKMKTITFLIVCLSFLFMACDRNSTFGEDTPPEFNPSSITFNAGANTLTIHNKNKQSWAFYDLRVNGLPLDSTLFSLEYPEGKEHLIWNVETVKGTWFTLKKISDREIQISVDATSEERTLSFAAYRGSSWQTISVRQEVSTGRSRLGYAGDVSAQTTLY